MKTPSIPGNGAPRRQPCTPTKHRCAPVAPMLGGALLAMFAAMPAAHATAASATLSFLAPATTFEVGQTFAVDVQLTGLAFTQPVEFFDIDMVYDPAVLSFVGIAPGRALGDVALGEAVDASLPPDTIGGTLNLALLSLLDGSAPWPAVATLGRVSFTAVGLGDGGLDFGFTKFEAYGGSAIAVSALAGNVSVVPEPSTFLMLGLGVAALLAGVKRRRAG